MTHSSTPGGASVQFKPSLRIYMKAAKHLRATVTWSTFNEVTDRTVENGTLISFNKSFLIKECERAGPGRFRICDFGTGSTPTGAIFTRNGDPLTTDIEGALVVGEIMHGTVICLWLNRLWAISSKNYKIIPSSQ